MPAETFRRRHLHSSLILLVCISLLYYLTNRLTTRTDKDGPSHNFGRQGDILKEDVAASDAWILERLELNESFDYHRYCMNVRTQESLERKGLLNIPQKFSLDMPQILQPFAGSEKLPACSIQLDVDVPSPPVSNTEEMRILLLGIATKLSRIQTSLTEMRRLLSHSGVRLVVLVVDTPDLDKEREAVAKIHARAADLGLDVVLYPYSRPEDSEGLKNFGLAGPLWDESRKLPQTRWVGVIDDDTFFVSLTQMVAKLNTYDHEKPLYLGQLSEGWTRVSNEGTKAWGGAGIFLSLPLLFELVKNVNECKPLDTGFGDILWRDCIYHSTAPTVKLTPIEGLNQMDFWGNPAGWYEAGHNPLLTVHHWKSWHFHPIPEAHLVADVAGPDSFLQRYSFADDPFVLTNGYSLVNYPGGIPDLNLVELTLVEDVGIERAPEWKEFHLSMGRTRPAMNTDAEKLSWGFVHAWKDSNGNVRQFYLRKRGNGRDRASLVEIDWMASG